MKTNQILESKDRELFGITIRQETKTCFLSVSDLQQAYEKARWVHGWSDKDISNILNNETTKERIFYLLENKGVIKTGFRGFIEMVNNEGIVKVLKGLGVYETKGARQTKRVFCDPYIWVLIALELNPMIYAKVLVWLTDSLIFDRIEAGTEYMPMNSAIKKIICNPDYAIFARAINEKVFGKHITGMRNLASSKELKMISNIEVHITRLIDRGYIKTQEQILFEIGEFTK
jgi:hypothetical protein